MIRGYFLLRLNPERQSAATLSPKQLADWLKENLYGITATGLNQSQAGLFSDTLLVVAHGFESQILVKSLRKTLTQFGQVSEEMRITEIYHY